MYRKIFFIFLLIASFSKAYSQASWEPFGQNRVQYRTFDWNYFDSTHFRVFYYDQGKSHALYSLNLAEQELSHIVYMMGGRLNKKLNIIIYNSFGDYRQTNIGRQNEALNKANGGKVDVVGDNIPIYFNGDHNHLKNQIRKGISSVIKDNMLFGDNIKDVVKNAVKMNLPEWYTLGYVAYISDEWNPEKQSEVNQMILNQKKKKFIDLAIQKPTLIGHSFWSYIAEQYGENYISNLLYLTRYRKSVNNALETVFKIPSKEIFKKWEEKYSITTNANTTDSLSGRTLLTKIKIKPESHYSQFSTSATGRELAYVLKKDGEFKVMMKDIRYDKTFEVVAGGIKANQELADPDYPMICWSPSGKKLAVLYQKKNQLMLRIFTSGKRKMENRVVPSNRIDRITGMCFMSDENSLAVTAIKKGQSDLYKLAIRNSRVEPITFDLFDDKNPSFVQNGVNTGILFMSNRTTPYIGENAKSDAFNHHFNLFLYDPSKGTNLVQLSNSNNNISNPIQWGPEDYAYIEEEKGKLVRKIAHIEKRGMEGDTFSTTQSAPTNFTLLNQNYIHQLIKVAEVSKTTKEYSIYLSPLDQLNEYDKKFFQSNPDYLLQDTTSLVKEESEFPEYITPYDNDTTSSLLEAAFQNKTKNKNHYQLFTGTIKKIKPLKYISTFYPDFIQTSLDNTLLFTRYQPFDYNGGSYQNPPLAGFLTSSLTDIMEDYKITGGIRLGMDFQSRPLDYFLQFNNYRKRTDWGLLYFHHSTTNLYDQRNTPPPFFSPYPVSGKVSMDYIQGSWTYPFDMLKSIRLQLGGRYDKIRIQAKDKYSIGIPDDNQFWLVSRAEFVYDNTITPLMNIWKGTRIKIFGEYQYKFNGDTKGFYNFGYDARNYLTLYKNLILASRIAGAHSGGNAKILYFLGGVDNDLNPKSDGNTGIDPTQNYAFQSLATNLRGYRQGARNGNSFMVVNEEIRLPIYNTFFKRPIKSGFIRNLQLVAFTDIGSAWKGILPNSDNIKNQNFVRDQNSPVTVFIDNSQYDFGLGYGLGLRTRLLGYFLRTDFAWNIEGSKKPIIHVSLATDF